MILSIRPTQFIQGRISLPSSKSYSIRSAIIASCGGSSLISNFSDCDDALVALKAAKSLGAKISCVKTNNYRIKACVQKKLPSKINVQESGTVLRFLLPLFALRGRVVKVIGEGTLKGRPNLFLVETLRRMGSHLKGKGAKESVPIQMKGGILKGGRIEIDGSLSSQFISALLITCPQLKENTCLILKGGRLVSLDYITMTLQVLKESGIKIKKINFKEFFIRGNQKFRGLKNFTVPSDYGLAAFLIAAAVFIKSDVVLMGSFNDRFIQADGQIFIFLQKMGVRFQKTKNFIRIQGPCHLKGGDFSLKNCPDLVPIMSILAIFAKGKTRLYDIAHVRLKESDRMSDLRTELLKIGAKVKETENELVIYPSPHYKSGVLLNPHHDHRLAMAFCILGLKIAVRVKDIECTRKSYPKFMQDLRTIGANVEFRH